MLLPIDEIKVSESLILRIEDSELILTEDLQDEIEDDNTSDDSDNERILEFNHPLISDQSDDESVAATPVVDSRPLQSVRIGNRKRALASAVTTTATKKKQKKLWCTCKKNKRGTMLECESDCCDIQWYHLSCIGLTVAPSEDDHWFCDICKEKQ